MRKTPGWSPTETLVAANRAMQLALRQIDAKVRVVFIGGSDRSVIADYTGRSDTRGYPVRSEINALKVELKYEGCVGSFESTAGNGHR